MYDADGNPFESNCGTSRNGKRHYYYRVKSTGASIRRDEAEDRVRRASRRCSMRTPSWRDDRGRRDASPI